MQSRFRRLQPLMTLLRVFEAAARQASFTRAADELNLSQPSVSRHIAALERDLGTDLFHRNHNRIALTKAGQTLAEATGWGLSRILDAVEFVTVSPARKEVVLACTMTFAHGWLMPRFGALRRAAGNARIALKVSSWLQDIDPGEVDMLIGWRMGGHTDWPRMPLFPEALYPVCAPSVAAALALPVEPKTLSGATLLQFDLPEEGGFSWPEWFAHFGITYVPLKKSHHYSNYQFTIQAAMDGDGIALGWHHLVCEHLAAGRLVRAGPVFSPPEAMSSLEYRPRSLSGETMEPILAWFKTQAEQLPRVESGDSPD